MESTLRETWDGWEWSHVPGAPIRGYDLALSCKDRSIAEIWSLHLSQRTLAKGDRLLHYICYAKIVNNLPKTREERIYINKLCYQRELQLLNKR